MAFQPDFILNMPLFTLYGFNNRSLRKLRMNGRLSQYIDPKTNLINENENFKHKTWILPSTTQLRGFSLLLLFSLGSIAQNKIAGVITDGDGQKLTTVEVYNKTTNIKVTDAGALNLI
jgi:hypothetical protein